MPSTHSRGDYGDTPEAIRGDVTRLAEAGNAAGLRALVDRLPARQELHYERHRARALALALAGALEEAEAELAVAFAGHGPATAAVAADLAQVRLLAGRPDEALAALTPALRAGGGADPSVRRVAGEIAHAGRGGWRKAVAAGLAARPFWHAAPVAAAAVGGALRGRGQPVPFGRVALAGVCLAGAVATIALLPRGTIDGIDRLRPHVEHSAEAPAVVHAPNASRGQAAEQSGRPTSTSATAAPGASLSALGVPTGFASIRGGPSQPLPRPTPSPGAPEAPSPGTPPQPEPPPTPAPSPPPTPAPSPTPAPQPAPTTSGAASAPPPTSSPAAQPPSSGSSGKGKGRGNDKPKDRPKPKEKDKDKPSRPSAPTPASTQPAPSPQTAQPEQEQESTGSDDHGKDKEKGDDGDKGHGGDDDNGKGKDKGK